MPPRLSDWPAFLVRLAGDEFRRKFKYYAGARVAHPTKYLSPTGLALSCDACGGLPYLIDGREELIDLSTYGALPDRSVIWMRIDSLPRFNREMLPHMRGRFVLVTGESDWSVPSNFTWAARTILGSGKLIRWFSVNQDGTVPEDTIVPVPLGLDYPKRHELTLNSREGSYCTEKKPARVLEAEWEQIARTARPVDQRPLLAVADFHFNDTAHSRKFGETRTEIRQQLAGNPHIVWPARRDPDPLAPRRRYAAHAFVIVAYGRGLDGHRVWEALLLGCIVIVKRGPLDALYRGLPVVSLHDWSEITAENLRRWREQYGPAFDRSRVAEILSMDHWVRRLRAAAAAP